jgi:hypothetical protein
VWKVSIPRLAKKDATWPSARVVATDNFRRVSESYYGIVSGRSLLARSPSGRKAMEWFRRKTSIAGIQVSNWTIALAAVVVIWIIYRLIAH